MYARKHGQDVITTVRNYVKVKTKWMKVDQDIKFIKPCKKEDVVLTFAKVNLSIKSGSSKLKCKISKLIMQTEFGNKHHEKRTLRKEIRPTEIKLKSTLGFILFNALLQQFNIAIKSRQKSIICRHQKKLFILRTKQKQRLSDVNHIRDEYMKGIVHNYSSYVLSKDEEIALSYGLKNHIPTKTSRIAINTEFEQFYQRMVHDISHIQKKI